MSKFTDRLWQELMRGHRAELEQVPWPAADRRRRVLPRLVAGTTVGLAGAGTAIVLAIGAASSSPAFAVTKNPDGSVSVWIHRADGIAGANQKLAQYGVRAVAVPVVAGCAVGPPPPAALRAALVHARAAAIAAAGTARIYPDKIPAGKRLVLAATPGQLSVGEVKAVRGVAPPCFRYVAPAGCRVHVWAGPGGPGTVTTDTNTTGTATAPPTQTATTGTTTSPTATSGTNTGQVPRPSGPPPGAWNVSCPAPPPCAPPLGATKAPPTNTTTTGTTTAPATKTTTTGTTTTGAPPMPQRQFIGCPPPCAVGKVVSPGAARAAMAHDRAQLAKMRAALVQARAALAKARAAGAKH